MEASAVAHILFVILVHALGECWTFAQVAKAHGTFQKLIKSEYFLVLESFHIYMWAEM